MAWTPKVGGGGTDGDFTIAKPVGQIRYSSTPNRGTTQIAKQEFWQLRANWSKQALNTPAYFDASFVLVDESEHRDMGGGVVSWDRIWSVVPGTIGEKVVVPKTFKYLFTYWPGGVYTDAAIVSRTAAVRCDLFTDFWLSPPDIPPVPDAILYKFGGATTNSVWLVGGWPNVSAAAPNNDNAAYSFISGEIGIYMGAIYYRKRIYGPV